ncbi:MAG: hypothetical protein COA99_17215 [Moraxellaceae bacterium]|nr:MAG: hypothetical protein COA99_17215 [Moraxellaceae bacterium]
MSILLFICNDNSAQSDNYIDYYRNIEQAYQKGVFISDSDTTIFFMEKAFSCVSESFPEDLFVVAQAFLDKKDKIKYFEFLLKSIRTGIDSSEISKINAYSFLSTAQKNKCIDAYENYQFNIDTTLALELELVRGKDQKVRSELNNFDSKEKSAKHVRFQDSLNREWLISIIKTKGWPGRKVVGNYRANILLTHLDMNWLEDNFNLLIEEIKKGNLSASMLAYKFDLNSYMYLKQKIIYNSLMPSNFIPNAEGEDLRAIKRWEIGALSRKVCETRNYKFRKYRPKTF